jgi:LysM repeat protein
MRNIKNGYFTYRPKHRDEFVQVLYNIRVDKDCFFELNNKRIEEIKNGDTIKVPYKISGCPEGSFYRLKKNGTLADAANKSGMRLFELLRKNPYLNPGRVPAGQAVIIPDKSRANKYIKYIVEYGDTLSDVLRKFDVSIKELQEDNKRSDIFRLKTGQAILVRKKRINDARSYIMKNDEDLSTLADKHNKSVISILRANPHLRPQEFKEGMRITLPD